MLTTLWRGSAPLTVTGLAMIAVLALTALGLALDPRLVTGAPVWLKPAKFALSISIYAFTLAWIFTFLGAWRRTRRVVGWAMATHLRKELVLAALEMALWRRRPEEVIHHSDHGSQYISVEFGRRCREAGVRPSMGTVGDCYDNAMCESFFATLECELLDRTCFRTQSEARRAVFEFIEGWYNLKRRHSALGYISPAEFERRLNMPDRVHVR